MCSRRDVIAVECLAFHSYHIATWTHIHNNILTDQYNGFVTLKDFELPDDGFNWGAETCWSGWSVINYPELICAFCWFIFFFKSCPSNADVTNEWGYTSTPLIRLHGVDRENFIIYSRSSTSWVNNLCGRYILDKKGVEFQCLAEGENFIFPEVPRLMMGPPKLLLHK